jgi:predicted ATPase/DNA-binding winged helix-turn-helix (wHTH) protein
VIWTFGAFELDDRARTLRRAGELTPLRRKVFDVLCYLVTRSGELVTKDELLEKVWPNETIIPSVIPQNITVLRRALDDTRGAGRIIQTVHGKGYRFVASVQRCGTRAFLPPSAAFVGRDHALGTLRAQLQSALAGHGQVAVVQGEAGVGKTRLLQELLHEARQHARVAVVHCQDTAGALPYRPWRDLLRQLIDAGAVRAPGAGGEVARLLRELCERAPREAHFAVFDGVIALLAQACRERPLVLVLDDLHQAEELSVQLFAFAARELRRLPLLLAATSRPVARRSALEGVRSETDTRRVQLAGLSAQATGELLGLCLGRPLPAQLFEDAFVATDGNPCLVLELARALSDTTCDDHAQRRGLQEVLQLRVRRLGAKRARILELAAVIGREIRLPVLEALAGVSRDELLDALSAARDAHLLSDLTTFAHALIHESSYDAVPAAERARLHYRAGVALEALLGDDTDAHLAELAWHFQSAAISGDAARAVKYCKLAAERACEQRAFERGATYYRAALAALVQQLPVDEQLRFQLRAGLRAALFRAGEDGAPALKQ